MIEPPPGSPDDALWKASCLRKLDTGDLAHGVAADYVIPLDEEFEIGWAFVPHTWKPVKHKYNDGDMLFITIPSDCSPVWTREVIGQMKSGAGRLTSIAMIAQTLVLGSLIAF